jgi:hypothetical protein
MLPSLLAVLAGGCWVGLRYLDTIHSACECEDPVDGARFAVLNPFRDRASERVAIQVIKVFQAGKCAEIPELKDNCRYSGRHVMSAYKLTGTWNYAGGIGYRFWVTWTDKAGNSDGDPVFVYLWRDGKVWKVSDVSTYF